MKIGLAKESHVMVHGAIETSTMTVDTNASLFQLLSERLYSDPVTAAIREIVTNAWDSHIVSDKKTTAIKIMLSDNSVTVEDFGKGIPHDKFLSLYGALGASSKRENLEQTGGLGIGKLAPLALVDSFIVKNANNGILRIYSINKGSSETNNNHTISLLSEIPSDDEGFSVSFQHSYNKDDIIQMCERNNIKADIYYGDVLVHSTESVDHSVARLRNNPYWYSEGCYVLWGNNSYKIDLQAHFDRSKANQIMSTLKPIINQNKAELILTTDERLDITPSRETLITSEHNTEVLNKLFNRFFGEVRKNKKQLLNNYADVVGSLDRPALELKSTTYTHYDNFTCGNVASLSDFFETAIHKPETKKEAIYVCKAIWGSLYHVYMDICFPELSTKPVLRGRARKKEVALKNKHIRKLHTMLMQGMLGSQKKDIFTTIETISKNQTIVLGDYNTLVTDWPSCNLIKYKKVVDREALKTAVNKMFPALTVEVASSTPPKERATNTHSVSSNRRPTMQFQTLEYLLSCEVTEYRSLGTNPVTRPEYFIACSEAELLKTIHTLIGKEKTLELLASSSSLLSNVDIDLAKIAVYFTDEEDSNLRRRKNAHRIRFKRTADSFMSEQDKDTLLAASFYSEVLDGHFEPSNDKTDTYHLYRELAGLDPHKLTEEDIRFIEVMMKTKKKLSCYYIDSSEHYPYSVKNFYLRSTALKYKKPFIHSIHNKSYAKEALEEYIKYDNL